MTKWIAGLPSTLTAIPLPMRWMTTLSLSVPRLHLQTSPWPLTLLLTLDLHLSATSPAWCEETLSSFKLRCAAGLDKIPSSALIAAKSVICFPLCSSLNSSISSSVFPHPWKCAAIKPLHKGGDRGTPANYRPISLLPVCSKLLERCVNEQMTSHLISSNLIFPLQSGSRPKHSTQTLLHCTDSWYKALDRKQFVGVMFLDISKALILLTMNFFLPNSLILACLPQPFHGFGPIFLIDHR